MIIYDKYCSDCQCCHAVATSNRLHMYTTEQLVEILIEPLANSWKSLQEIREIFMPIIGVKSETISIY